MCRLNSGAANKIMLLEKFTSLIDLAVDRLGRASAWLTLAMVLVLGLIVVMRYLFKTGSISLQESVMYINAMIFMIGAAYTLKEQGHVRVDIFYRKLTPRWQAVIDCVGYLLFLFPTAIFIIYASWDYVSISWQIKESSAETSGLPIVYLLKSTILVLAFLLIVQGLSEFGKAVNKFRQSLL